MSLCTQATVEEGEIHSPKSDYFHWTVHQVVAYLKSNAGSLFNDEDTARLVTAFQEHQIDGPSISLLTRDLLGTMGIKPVGVQNKVLTLFRDLQQNIEGKVFNDPIHGHFVLHPLLVKVIDTPQFQRLRNIKQMGGGYYVYPGASHNRFEHSLGVCHIAGEFVELLQKKQPELGITGVDVLCVKMAGLCHDLGHGPFSHLFDSMFIPAVRPGTHWKHEDASITMLDHLLKKNDLISEFERYGLKEQDIVFIKEMIIGSPLCDRKCDKKQESDDKEELQGSWRYEGRTEEKSFLYEIVTNKINGVDVDKWDYFARDGHCLGISNNFDMQRYMKFTRVIPVNGRLQICARDKEINNLYVMFHTRLVLHLRASQQTTKRLIEQMITEALIEANDHLLLSGENGPVRMSDAIYDMTAYSRLTDGVLYLIMASSDPELKKSQDLLLQVEERKFYKYIGQTQPVSNKSKLAKEETIQKQLADSLTSQEMLEGLPELTKDDFLVQVVKFDYGKQDENPIDKMRFYAKGDPDIAFKLPKEEVSQLLPYNFQEMTVRVFCKKRDKKSTSAALKYFLSWCKKHDLKVGTPRKTQEKDETLSDGKAVKRLW